jgi:uncharacterized integral membrane protein
MIREFIGPRTVLVFALLFALIWLALFAWMKASRPAQRDWLTHARLPAIAAVIAAAVTGVLVAFVLLFD